MTIDRTRVPWRRFAGSAAPWLEHDAPGTKKQRLGAGAAFVHLGTAKYRAKCKQRRTSDENTSASSISDKSCHLHLLRYCLTLDCQKVKIRSAEDKRAFPKRFF